MVTQMYAASLTLATLLAGASGAEPQGLAIPLDIEGVRLTATLIDTPTARDFVALLPLTLTLRDYAATEKISELPRRLSTEGAPAGYDPEVGDIAYDAPCGNVALCYRDLGYSPGLILLGRLEGSLESINLTRLR